MPSNGEFLQGKNYERSCSFFGTIPNDCKYEVILYWSWISDAVNVEVPELPGCATDGGTYQETLANAEVIIREWIETARVGSTHSGSAGTAPIRCSVILIEFSCTEPGE